METIKRADQLAVGDELKLDNGSYAQVKGLHLPGTDWNHHTTVVRISLGSCWQSWPVSKRVTVIATDEVDS